MDKTGTLTMNKPTLTDVVSQVRLQPLSPCTYVQGMPPISYVGYKHEALYTSAGTRC